MQCDGWRIGWNALLEERSVAGRRTHRGPASRGLARELLAEYPQCENKVQILPQRRWMQKRCSPPQGFNRESFRHELGLAPGDFAIVFVSLGHYERKGLPQHFWMH